MTNRENRENREHSERLAWREKIEQGKCMFPDCSEPSLPDQHEKSFPICAGHLAYTDARAELDEIQAAENILEPWVQSCEAIGFDVLTRHMQAALDAVRDEKAVWQNRMDQAGREIDKD